MKSKDIFQIHEHFFLSFTKFLKIHKNILFLTFSLQFFVVLSFFFLSLLRMGQDPIGRPASQPKRAPWGVLNKTSHVYELFRRRGRGELFFSFLLCTFVRSWCQLADSAPNGRVTTFSVFPVGLLRQWIRGGRPKSC